MLCCEGYKMFKGTGCVKPKSAKILPFKETGTWLFKPDTNCWYVNGKSFMADIVTDITEEQPFEKVEDTLLGVKI